MSQRSYFVVHKLQHITDSDRLAFLIHTGGRLVRYKDDFGTTKYAFWYKDQNFCHGLRPKDVIDDAMINYPLYTMEDTNF